MVPAAAAARLSELQMQRDAALDAGNACAQRLNNLPRDASASQRDRLASERDRHQARHRALAALLSRANQFLMECRGTLEMVPPPVIEHKSGTDLSAAIASARDAISSTKQRLQAVRTAPLAKEDAKRLAVEFVQRLQRTGKVGVAVMNDQIKLSFRGDMFAPEDTLAMIAQFAPDQVRNALVAALDAQPVGSDAVSADQRKRLVAELQEQLDGLERQEAALLEHAHENGVDVLYRIDMSPAAFLGVTVTQAKAAAA
jgi:hypothetical protein